MIEDILEKLGKDFASVVKSGTRLLDDSKLRRLVKQEISRSPILAHGQYAEYKLGKVDLLSLEASIVLDMDENNSYRREWLNGIDLGELREVSDEDQAWMFVVDFIHDVQDPVFKFQRSYFPNNSNKVIALMFSKAQTYFYKKRLDFMVGGKTPFRNDRILALNG